MRLFTENLPYFSKAWGPGLQRLCLLIVAGAMMGAQPVTAEGVGTEVTAILVPPIKDTAAHVPRPLTAPDADRYQRIFALQEDGNWRAADRLVSRLGDLRLLGHVLAQRYLHPTKYKARYSELRDWLAKYGDHPEAPQIHALALEKRPAGAAGPLAPTVDKVAYIGNPDNSREPNFFNWQAGLEAWRAGDMGRAAEHFEKVAQLKKADAWTRAAGAFWAARSYLKHRRPDLVTRWLREGAQYPRTFYGQLSRRALGMDSGLDWTVEPVKRADARQILETRSGARALALIQIGLNDLAESEMHLLLQGKAGKSLGPALLAVAQAANLPSLSLRLGYHFEARSGERLDTALYPLPTWEPQNGFSVEPALLFALMRQESAFDPSAKSPAGATGLMQLMPATAAAMAHAGDIVGYKKRALLDPQTNLTLAQRYVDELLALPRIKGDLVLMLSAYNAGPGNLQKWMRRGIDDQDPLLFIESIPITETRHYVERVFTYYWIYQERLGLPTPSLDALASGAWPMYSPPAAQAAANNGTY
jgi:soluble lytic murein transglycosylase-like protein